MTMDATGTTAQRLALGTAQFGMPYGIANQRGQVSGREVGEILGQARKAGLDTLDTAIMYGNSEQALGDAGLAAWRVISKLPAFPEDCPNLTTWARAAVSGSLRRLGIAQLGGLLLHRRQQMLGPRGDELFAALRQLQQDGLIQKVGISIYGPEELEALMAKFAIDLVQAPFNLLDRRLADSGWLARLSQQGIEVHARSIFLQGLLLMPAAQRPVAFARWQPLWDRWEAWLQETGLTPLQACLRFVLGYPEIDRVVVGLDGLAQLQQILDAAPGDRLEPPADFACADLDLIHPAHWGK